MELCYTPILFNKIEFAVIFGVKIIYMFMRFDQLLKLGLLRDEIRLQKSIRQQQQLAQPGKQ